MEAKLKHLEFVQGVVNRLAGASFKMKGWCVILVSALLVVLAEPNRPGPAAMLVIFIPAGVFWALDGYYLAQEGRFRRLYDHVRKLDVGEVDFSMDVGPFKGSGRYWSRDWPRAVRSRTLWPFYLILGLLAPVGALLIGGVR